MYMLWFSIRGFTSIFIPIPAKTWTVSGRPEDRRSVRSLTHISHRPKGPVNARCRQGRPSPADTDLVSIVEKHGTTDDYVRAVLKQSIEELSSDPQLPNDDDSDCDKAIGEYWAHRSSSTEAYRDIEGNGAGRRKLV